MVIVLENDAGFDIAGGNEKPGFHVGLELHFALPPIKS
jgi:hypothetical protein